MPSDILPENIMEITTWYCKACQSYLDESRCPKCNAAMFTELPPLGVHICDTAGVAGKVGS